MKTAYQSLTDDQLSRKLQLLLGSQEDWILPYTKWCVDNSVESGQCYDDHHVWLFVKHIKLVRATAKPPSPVLPQKRG